MPSQSEGNIGYEIAVCNGCNRHFLVKRSTNSNDILEIHPHTLPHQVDKRIKAEIRSDIEEAYKCMSVGAYRAAATMARRALQKVCIDQGAPKVKKNKDGKDTRTQLWEQIDWLSDQRIVTSPMKDWAHEVRFVGNGGAHPEDIDDDQAVTETDAVEILDLLEQITNVLYVTDSKYHERKSAREAQQANSSSDGEVTS